MSPSIALLTFFAILALLTVTRAQDRAPHGLLYDNHPTALSPQAYEFFHPETQQASTKTPLDAENRAPLPLTATVQSDVAYASRSTPEAGKSGVGAGAITGIVFGVAFVVVLAMGVYYVAIKRTTILNRKKSTQPDA